MPFMLRSAKTSESVWYVTSTVPSVRSNGRQTESKYLLAATNSSSPSLAVVGVKDKLRTLSAISPKTASTRTPDAWAVTTEDSTTVISKMAAIKPLQNFFTLDNHLSHGRMKKKTEDNIQMPLTFSEWIVGIIELCVIIAVLVCFFRSMKTIRQNQQILIDELEALRKELKDKKM